MPIDLASVDWLYVIVLALFVLVASAAGNVLSFNRIGMGALLSAIFFAAIFVFWTYYPHKVPLLPTRLSGDKPIAAEPAGMPSPQPAAPVKPRNPVTDITPPSNQ